MIIIVDRAEPIEAFLLDAADLLVNVLVTVVDVEVVEL
jgi:PII-like signaling protein